MTVSEKLPVRLQVGGGAGEISGGVVQEVGGRDVR